MHAAFFFTIGVLMSAAGRGSERMPDDVYETPAWCVHRLLEKVDLPSGRWFEPCGGSGQIIRAVAEKRPKQPWWCCEIREECVPLLLDIPQVVDLHTGNFLEMPVASFKQVDVVLSNPPYHYAQEFVEKCLTFADQVVFLLRLNFLGSVERQKFFNNHMPDVFVLPNRPSFVQSVSCGETKAKGCGWSALYKLEEETPSTCPLCGISTRKTSSDATEYAWFRFFREPRSYGSVTVLDATASTTRKNKKE